MQQRTMGQIPAPAASTRWDPALSDELPDTVVFKPLVAVVTTGSDTLESKVEVTDRMNCNSTLTSPGFLTNHYKKMPENDLSSVKNWKT